MSKRELREVEKFVKDRADRLIRGIRAKAKGRVKEQLSEALWGLKGSLSYENVPKDKKAFERLIEIDEKIFMDLYVIKMALDEGRKEGIKELAEDLIRLRKERKGLEL